MRIIPGVAALAALSLGGPMAGLVATRDVEPRARYPRGTKPSGSIAERNRWTGEEHQNKREIARRQRQAAARAAKVSA